QSAAGTDVIYFRRIYRARFTRITIERIPERGPPETERAGQDKDVLPAEMFLRQREQRREKGEANILAGGVARDGAGAFAIRKPRGHHPIADGEGGRFENAEQ